MDIELLVTDDTGSQLFYPAVEEGIEWTTNRRGTPGKLTFKVINDGMLNISEGSRVRLTVDGQGVFYGFVFTLSRDKEQIITVTAYDQLRYLQNKDTFQYTATASGLVQLLAADFGLQVGELEETGYEIVDRTESNKSLFEMVENALDLTLTNTKEMYVMYDDFGKIALKNISGMQVPIVIDAAGGENFDYSSSIDSDTYNQVKLTYDNDKTGKREIYVVKDSGNIAKWGTLQYHDTVKENENGAAKAESLLSLYNTKTRKLQIKNAFGDVRVRAGSRVVIQLDLGDVRLQNFMLVESATHKFSKDEYLMNLTLRGGEFIA